MSYTAPIEPDGTWYCPYCGGENCVVIEDCVDCGENVIIDSPKGDQKWQLLSWLKRFCTAKSCSKR